MPLNHPKFYSLRERLLNISLFTITALAVLAVAGSLMRIPEFGWKGAISFQIICVLVLLFTAIFYKRLSYHFRVIVFLSVLLLGSIVGMLTWGLSGFGMHTLILVCMLTVLLLGLKWGIAVMFLSLGAIITVGAAAYSGWITFDVDFNKYAKSSSSWVVTTVGFSFFFVIIALIGKILTLLRESYSELELKNLQLAKVFEQRQKTEHNLRESERKFRDIANNMPGMVYQYRIRKDGSAYFSYTSPRAGEIFGLPDNLESEEWKSATLVHPDDREQFNASIQKAIECKSDWHFEGRFLSPEGDVKWFEGISSPHETDDELVFDGIFLDITKRKIVEKAMKKSSVIIDSTTDAVITTDLSGNITFWNRGAGAIYGYKKEEIIGKPIGTLYKKDDLPVVESLIAKLAKGEDITGIELTCIDKDQKEINILLSLTTIRDRDDKIIELVGITKDITKRKQAQEALSESEKRYKTLFESANDCIFLLKENTFVDCNPRTLEIFGCTRDEIVGSTPFDFSPPIQPDGQKSRDSGRQKIQAALTGKPQFFEWQHVKTDGTPFDTEVSLNVLELPKGTHILAIVRDITERKRAENELIASEIRFRSLVEQTTDAVFCYEYDPPVSTNSTIKKQIEQMYDGVLVECNKVSAKSYGATHPDEVLGKKLTELFRVKKGDLDDFFGKFIRNNYRTENAEAKEILDDGSVRYFVNNGYGVIENNFLTRIWGAYRDITEQKLAEHALKISEERYRLLIENIPTVVWTSSETGETRFISSNVEKVYGFAPEEIYESGSQLWFDRIHPEDRGRVQKEIGLLFQKDKTYDIEYRIKRKDGKWIWIHDKASTHKVFDGTSYAYGVFSDVTERKKAEDQIRILNTELEQRVKERTRELERVNNELEAFTYSVSHDLRAPLRAITGFGQALREDFGQSLSPEACDYLTRITKASGQMQKLIKDMLNLSRISRSKMNLKRVNLSKLAAEIIEELKHGKPDRKVDFIIKPDIIVTGDDGLLRILMTNLLDNAWKYTQKQPSPCIEFGTTKENGRQALFVRDNGVGFDMKYANRLFTPFQRLHSKNEFTGTGVGLSTVQRIIHRHLGEIWAEAKINKGATFFFTLNKTRFPST